MHTHDGADAPQSAPASDSADLMELAWALAHAEVPSDAKSEPAAA